MILIWRGFGFLVPLLPFLLSILVNLVTESLWGRAYYSEHAWPLSFSLWLAAGLLWTIGRALEKKNPGKVLIDPETNQQYHFVRKHDFFWIKLQIWAPILAAVAIVLLFMRGV